MHRRHFLITVAAAWTMPPGAARAGQTYAISEAERLIAAIQDGGKIIYLIPTADAGRLKRLGGALRALRVPLNDIRTGRAGVARQAADTAFGESEIVAATELDFRPDDLLRTPPAPGHNRVLIGQRGPLEMATGRRFAATALPEGGMAIFLPGTEMHLLGIVTADRVIRAAEIRGALPR